MVKFFKYIFIFFSVVLIGCIKSEEPTNEKNDEEHEEWSKITLKFTETASKEVQMLEYISDNGVARVQSREPIKWQVGKSYHLELVYFNIKGERMNWEYVTPEMAPIHQHFFILGNNDRERRRFSNLSSEQIKELISYEYQDTDPEDGYLEQGATLRKRTWDTKKPNEIDPIGLKGVFHIKPQTPKNLDMRILLAHLTGGRKVSAEGDLLFEFCDIPISSYFKSDLSLIFPIQIQ